MLLHLDRLDPANPIAVAATASFPAA
jgi:hypothetical protein